MMNYRAVVAGSSRHKRAVRARTVPMLTATVLMIAHVALAQEPVHSFQQLHVRSGQQILVKPDGGRTANWRVVSILGTQLEVERRRWNFKTERRIFTEDAVKRIDLRDSTLDGVLIGTGVGLGSAFFIYSTCQDLGCLMPFMLSIAMGPTMGGLIDEAINRTIFTPGQRGKVTISPLVAPNRLGVTAHVRFGPRP